MKHIILVSFKHPNSPSHYYLSLSTHTHIFTNKHTFLSNKKKKIWAKPCKLQVIINYDFSNCWWWYKLIELSKVKQKKKMKYETEKKLDKLK
jgi:hypothetical protein